MQFPLSQRRHTNIAVVRYMKNGVKLEIACYKNKVISYRSGVEDRLDEVLQVNRVFTNVGRGLLASKKDICTVFCEDMPSEQCIKYILDHGELQVAHQERTAEIDELFKDIAVMISQKCVHKDNGRPFPSPVIEQSLRSIGATVKQDQPVKKQALSLIQQLIESQIIPIARAKMKVRCTTTSNDALHLLDQWCAENLVVVLEKSADHPPSPLPSSEANVMAPSEVEEQHTLHSKAGMSPTHRVSFWALILLPPHLFRLLDVFIKQNLPPGSTVHMVDPAVMDVSGVSDTTLSVGAPIDVESTEALRDNGQGQHSFPFTSSPFSETKTVEKSVSGKQKLSNGSVDNHEDDCSTHSEKNSNKKKKVNKKADSKRSKEPKIGETLGKEVLSNVSPLALTSDSGGRKKTKKEKKNQKCGSVAEKGVKESSERTSLEPPLLAPSSEENDSDAELETNRRQRKKLNKKPNDTPLAPSCDEGDFSYGDEVEEDEVDM